MDRIRKILSALGVRWNPESAESFRTEEDGTAYQVWKLRTDGGDMVLKKTTPMERQVYETFLADGSFAPKVFAFGTYENETYMLMEFISGQTMSRCTRSRLIRTLDALIDSQKAWWGNESHADAGYGFDAVWVSRVKRLAYLGDLAEGYQAYLDAFSAVPRTLCNDDLLPFNILADEDRAVILDWEYGGILPYPTALARFLAFGEEDGELFRMSEEDRQFALDYYYDRLIREKGISRAEFDRTMDLFFLKEYAEWVYCAALSGDYEMEYCKKYGPKARTLARKLGFWKEKEVAECFD